MKKKLLVIALAFAMVLAFAACGGGGGSEAPAEDAVAAEPNNGVGGIVFSLPEGCAPESINVGSYASYKMPDSDCYLIVNCIGEEQLEERTQWSDEKYDSVQDYYDKNFALSEEDAKAKSIDTSTVKICDVDATYNKYTGDKNGVYELGTYWMLDNTIYALYLINDSSYDDNGELKDDATPYSDDQIKQFEDIIASVQRGDGTALQKEALAALSNSIGSFTYEVPAGYTLMQYGNGYANFEKDGSSISLQFSVTDEDSLQYYTLMDGSTPKSLKDLFNERLYEGIEMTTIAGCEGYVNKWPDENGQYYTVDASFLSDDGMYDIYMGSDAWDENGELKEDAEALTEDDLAAFDAILTSLSK